MGALAKGLKPGLYAITDARLTPDDRLVSCVEAALRGGAVLVQYRDKSASARERLRQATELQAVCRNAGVPLIINDDPELARRVGAAGAHLGQRDGSLARSPGACWAKTPFWGPPAMPVWTWPIRQWPRARTTSPSGASTGPQPNPRRPLRRGRC